MPKSNEAVLNEIQRKFLDSYNFNRIDQEICQNRVLITSAETRMFIINVPTAHSMEPNQDSSFERLEPRDVKAATINAGINVENFSYDLESIANLVGWELGKQIAEKEAAQIALGLEQNHGLEIESKGKELSVEDISNCFAKLAQNQVVANTAVLNPLDIVPIGSSPRFRPRWIIEKAGTKVTTYFEGVLDWTMNLYYLPQLKDSVFLFDRSNVIIYKSDVVLSFDDPINPTEVVSKSYCVSSPADPRGIAKIILKR